jgi:hypothetical protein
MNGQSPGKTRRQRVRAISRRRKAGLLGLTFCALTSLPNSTEASGRRMTSGENSPAEISAALARASDRFHIPVHWLRAVMRAESDGDTRAVSGKGAIGLMQVMPVTYAELSRRYLLGPDPFDPMDNIQAGAAYLSEMLSRYGERGFLAAYNAGPRRYEEHLRGRPLPAETTDYVARIEPRLHMVSELKADILASAQESIAPIFVAAVMSAPRPEKRVASAGKDSEGVQTRKEIALPHTLFAAQAGKKIFANETQSDHAKTSMISASPSRPEELFVNSRIR